MKLEAFSRRKMLSNIPSHDELEPKTQAFYCQVLENLHASKIPFLVGGTYAFVHYTGIVRQTKDLDISVRPSDCPRLFQIFEAQGYSTELRASHWLGKIFCEKNFVDVIFNSANGIDPVDEAWFEHAIEAKLFDIPVRLCAPEEMIRSKAFVMGRDRWDGADVAHLLRACSQQLDWSRLVDRFGSHWRILLSHLILFGFIYPAEQERIPNWVMQELLQRLQSEMNGTAASADQLCQGTLLSPTQYQVDVECWGYQDARLQPQGNMTPAEVTEWIVALQEEK
jgi:hypothetical protein